MSVTVTTKTEITVVKSVPIGPGGAQTKTLTDTSLNTTQLKLTSTSSPPVQDSSNFQATLSSGSAAIDLTALTNLVNQTIASTGMRVQAIKVQNPNANQLAVAPSGSNGYGLTFIVPPQGEVQITSENLLPVIGSGAKSLTLTGTGAQVSNWLIVVG